MRKTSFIILLLVSTFVLSGCLGSKLDVPTGDYKDGQYDIKHKSEKVGYEEAVITITNGFLRNVELKKLDDNQKEVDYNEWDGTKEGRPNLKKARDDLAKMMIAKQSAEVDAITGATQSSNGWKAAASEALAKAK